MDYSGREIPLVHMNGTSKRELMEQCEAAVSALAAARAGVGATAPNARDYYPMGEATYRKALNEHYARMDKLEALAAEITHIWEAIDAQGGGR